MTHVSRYHHYCVSPDLRVSSVINLPNTLTVYGVKNKNKKLVIRTFFFWRIQSKNKKYISFSIPYEDDIPFMRCLMSMIRCLFLYQIKTLFEY